MSERKHDGEPLGARSRSGRRRAVDPVAPSAQPAPAPSIAPMRNSTKKEIGGLSGSDLPASMRAAPPPQGINRSIRQPEMSERKHGGEPISVRSRSGCCERFDPVAPSANRRRRHRSPRSPIGLKRKSAAQAGSVKSAREMRAAPPEGINRGASASPKCRSRKHGGEPIERAVAIGVSERFDPVAPSAQPAPAPSSPRSLNSTKKEIGGLSGVCLVGACARRPRPKG